MDRSVINITELSDTILEIGETVLHTSPVHWLIERMQAGVVTRDFVGMFKTLHDTFVDFVNLRDEIQLKFPLTDIQIASEDYTSYLALGLLEHDLCNRAAETALDDFFASLSDYRLNDDDVREFEFSKEHIFSYENLRICTSLIPYLINGDRRYISRVKSRYVPQLVESLEEIHEPRCNYMILPDTISSDEYFCMYQLVKNAKKNLLKLKEEKGKPVENINISLVDENSTVNLCVDDCGSGITMQNLPLIFRAFTDTEHGTGYGLQAVKRLVALRNGHGFVISKVDGQKGYGYGILPDMAKDIGCTTRDHGTTFNLYFPNA